MPNSYYDEDLSFNFYEDYTQGGIEGVIASMQNTTQATGISDTTTTVKEVTTRPNIVTTTPQLTTNDIEMSATTRSASGATTHMVTTAPPTRSPATAHGPGLTNCNIYKICKFKVDVSKIIWQEGQPYNLQASFRDEKLNNFSDFRQVEPLYDPVFMYYGYIVFGGMNEYLEKDRSYLMDITFNGDPIIGSPFRVDLGEQRFYTEVDEDDV